jgi:hypothetical protein
MATFSNCSVAFQNEIDLEHHEPQKRQLAGWGRALPARPRAAARDIAAPSRDFIYRALYQSAAWRVGYWIVH